MTSSAYWLRVLGRLWVHDAPMRLTYTALDGSTKRWTGKLRALGMDGPYITWQGEARRLCGWDRLISVEDAPL